MTMQLFFGGFGIWVAVIYLIIYLRCQITAFPHDVCWKEFVADGADFLVATVLVFWASTISDFVGMPMLARILIWLVLPSLVVGFSILEWRKFLIPLIMKEESSN
jgi:hypothetical protein